MYREGVEDSDVQRLAEACLAENLSSAEVARLHAALCVDTSPGTSLDLASYAFGMRLLERVLREMQADKHKTLHDLRNRLQMITGSLSLLERDLSQNSGARAMTILGRVKNSAWELARRIEAMSSQRR